MKNEERVICKLKNGRTGLVLACLGLMFATLLPQMGHAQQTCIRIMVQDSTLNNLVDPAGYKTASLGSLGGVKQVGTGPKEMILIPGLGFGGDVFDELMARWGDNYRMHAVTLPGFGGTAAPLCPAESVSYGAQTWTNGALRGIEDLIKNEKIEKPIIIGHWLTGTQLALRLALDHPKEVRAVIIVAGSARFVPTDTTRMGAHPPLARRVAGIDRYMAPRWYKTVTRATWDDNNFLPLDYAVNPVRGLRLWREAAEPSLHVWVRYLCEFYAQDISLELGKLTVPTLVIMPGLDGIYHDPSGDYMTLYTHSSWDGTGDVNPKIKFVTIPDSRACLWFDQPEKFDSVVEEFLKSVE